jgi:glycosyltransferase involved in cell wall biosynthesis
VELDLFLNEVPWQEKSDEILILNYKVNPQPLLDRLTECYQAKYTPSLPKFKIVRNLTHDEWAKVLKKHKFFLNASPVEGFGLPSLEAMASGCVVLGLDSYGGRDYFESGRNSLVVPEDGVDQLADYLYELIRDPNKGVDISRNAVSTAKNFSYSNYKESWEHFLEKKVFCTV